MRVIICGGRALVGEDWPFFRDHVGRIALDRFPRHEPDAYGNYLYNVTIISGAAKGADTLAIDWAINEWCLFEEHPADWKRYPRAAGPIRNKQMLDSGCDLVIAFDTGGKGTANMMKIAEKAGVEVIRIDCTKHRSEWPRP